MTNEEKAKEIARKYATEHITSTSCCFCEPSAENAALEMAEWKDEQLEEAYNQFRKDHAKFHRRMANRVDEELVQLVLDTETEMLKEIAENKMAKPATREEYIKILTERVKEVMNGN